MATRHKHRVSVRVVDRQLDPEAPWYEFEFLHTNPDRRAALMAYLREQFVDRRAVSETRDGVFVVVDPTFQNGTVVRQYRA